MGAVVSVPSSMVQEVPAPPTALRALAYQYPQRYPVLLDSAAVSGQGSWSETAALSSRTG